MSTPTKPKIPAERADNFCKQIIPTERNERYPDSKTPGLRLRVTPQGSKSWVLDYKVKSAPESIKRKGDNYTSRSMSLGPFNHGRAAPANALTVKQARDLAADIKAKVKRGEDPAAEKRRTELDRIAQESARKLVLDVFEEWHADDISKRKDGGVEVRRMMEKDVLPSIGKLGVQEVRKLHISTINSAVKMRGSRIANVVFSLMRQLFNYAIERDYIEQNPTAGIKKSKVGSGGEIRERVLSHKEITELFEKLPNSGLVGLNQLALPFQLATGCRIKEVLEAKWQYIDLEERTWTILSDSSKNARAHKVHLSDFALRYLSALRALSGHPEWLFPASRTDGHLNTKTLTKQVADRQRSSDQIIQGRTVRHAQALMLSSNLGEQWRPHDLRRTAATLMTELGVLPEVAERCLNHLEPNRIKRTYQQFSYWPQMVDAWNRLGDKLAHLTDSDNSNILPFSIGNRTGT
jgi:integrase